MNRISTCTPYYYRTRLNPLAIISVIPGFPEIRNHFRYSGISGNSQSFSEFRDYRKFAFISGIPGFPENLQSFPEFRDFAPNRTHSDPFRCEWLSHPLGWLLASLRRMGHRPGWGRYCRMEMSWSGDGGGLGHRPGAKLTRHTRTKTHNRTHPCTHAGTHAGTGMLVCSLLRSPAHYP